MHGTLNLKKSKKGHQKKETKKVKLDITKFLRTIFSDVTDILCSTKCLPL